MLKRFLYMFVMNHALWKLGIEPTSVSKKFGKGHSNRGCKKEYSPREMAAAIAYGRPGEPAFLARENDRFPPSRRITILKATRVKLRPEPAARATSTKHYDPPRGDRRRLAWLMQRSLPGTSKAPGR